MQGSTSTIAIHGCKGLLAPPVPWVLVGGVCEVIWATDKAREVIQAQPEWNGEDWEEWEAKHGRPTLVF
jgi:hypothetical protein